MDEPLTQFCKELASLEVFDLMNILDRRQRGPVRSVLLVIGWLVIQFSQKRP